MKHIRAIYLFAMLAILFSCGQTNLSKPTGTLTMARSENGLWGYQDTDGLWVIPARFSFISPFSDDVALAANLLPDGSYTYFIINKQGEKVAEIPVQGINLASQFHHNYLLYKDLATGSFGFIDANGLFAYPADGSANSATEAFKKYGIAYTTPQPNKPEIVQELPPASTIEEPKPAAKRIEMTVTPQERMREALAWLYESARIASQQPADSTNRQVILNYVECLRTAYEAKDIDFINQVFSDDALIIVGKVIKAEKSDGSYLNANQIEYNVRTKQQYLQNLKRIFAANSRISLNFSQAKVVHHPTINGFYGVTLKQGYQSDTYSDEGYLFLLWDFRKPQQPTIHVRTWQPSQIDAHTLLQESEVFSLRDFTLE